MNNTPTPRSKIILDHIKIYVEADNAAQSYAHYKEVNREIESMERELTAVTEQRDRLAEALKEYREALHDGPENCSYKMYEAVDEFAREALQPLNQNAELCQPCPPSTPPRQETADGQGLA